MIQVQEAGLVEVVTGVLVDHGFVFLLQRPFHGPVPAWNGAWCCPGGKVEAGEDHASALSREFEEETGALVEGGPLLHATVRRTAGYPHPYRVTHYLVEQHGGEKPHAREPGWKGQRFEVAPFRGFMSIRMLPGTQDAVQAYLALRGPKA